MSDWRAIRPVVVVAVLLFALWIALSQELDSFHLGLGLISAAVIAFATRGLYRSPPRPMPPDEFARTPLNWRHFLAYWMWLVVQIFRAATDVARVVLDPRLPIAPRVVRIADDLPHPIARVTLAHSITLTPGTVTIDCDDGSFEIHALDEAAAASVDGDGGPTARRVRRLFAVLTTHR